MNFWHFAVFTASYHCAKIQQRSMSNKLVRGMRVLDFKSEPSFASPGENISRVLAQGREIS